MQTLLVVMCDAIKQFILMCSNTIVKDVPKPGIGRSFTYLILFVVTDRDPGPGKSRPFFSDYYPGPGNFREQTGINRDHFYKSVICSRLYLF